MTLPRRATVHEKTVQKAAELDQSREFKKRQKGFHRLPHLPSGKISVTKVDMRVWTKALELAEGDRRRIKVIHTEEVIVTNPID